MDIEPRCTHCSFRKLEASYTKMLHSFLIFLVCCTVFSQSFLQQQYNYNKRKISSAFTRFRFEVKAAQDGNDDDTKKEMWERSKQNEKKRGQVLLSVILAVTVRFFFTDSEIRTLKICGHDYDAEVYDW